MKALNWIAGIFGVFLLLATVGGMFLPESPSEQAEITRLATETTLTSETIRQIEAAPKTWVKVADWKGAGMKNTEDFTITGSQWRITWAAKPDNKFGAGSFAVMVKQGGWTVGIAANIANQEGADVDYQRTKGVHHLEINSANMGWAVILEEQR